ncbi:MAG: replication initiation protein [Lachnospiraceae bacterium]|nr:replication initiation protein [Lachnospiraceae bacterium]
MPEINRRKQYIIKSNTLVQQSKFDLTKRQNFMLLYLLSMIKPNDEPGKEYTFSGREFNSLMGINSDSYTILKRDLKKMASITWWMDAEEQGEDDILMRWFDKVHANKGKDSVTITFHRELYPYILNLSETKYFTKFKLGSVLLMKNVYTPRIYELLKSYSNNEYWDFEIGTGSKYDLWRRIAGDNIPERWIKNHGNFEKQVLVPSKEDINKYTDLKIDYELSKTDFSNNRCGKFVRVRFYIQKKTDGEIMIAEERINKAFENYDKTVEPKKLEIILDEQNVTETEQKLTEFPEIIEFLTIKADWIDENGAVLAIEEAARHIVGDVDRADWITRYLGQYVDYIKYSSSKTRTNIFARFMDVVRNDYLSYGNTLNMILKNEKNDKNNRYDYEKIEKMLTGGGED